MDSYKRKYLKYKTKYEALKLQTGGLASGIYYCFIGYNNEQEKNKILELQNGIPDNKEFIKMFYGNFCRIKENDNKIEFCFPKGDREGRDQKFELQEFQLEKPVLGKINEYSSNQLIDFIKMLFEKNANNFNMKENHQYKFMVIIIDFSIFGKNKFIKMIDLFNGENQIDYLNIFKYYNKKKFFWDLPLPKEIDISLTNSNVPRYYIDKFKKHIAMGIDYENIVNNYKQSLKDCSKVDKITIGKYEFNKYNITTIKTEPIKNAVGDYLYFVNEDMKTELGNEIQLSIEEHDKKLSNRAIRNKFYTDILEYGDFNNGLLTKGISIQYIDRDRNKEYIDRDISLCTNNNDNNPRNYTDFKAEIELQNIKNQYSKEQSDTIREYNNNIKNKYDTDIKLIKEGHNKKLEEIKNKYEPQIKNLEQQIKLVKETNIKEWETLSNDEKYERRKSVIQNTFYKSCNINLDRLNYILLSKKLYGFGFKCKKSSNKGFCDDMFRFICYKVSIIKEDKTDKLIAKIKFEHMNQMYKETQYMFNKEYKNGWTGQIPILIENGLVPKDYESLSNAIKEHTYGPLIDENGNYIDKDTYQLPAPLSYCKN